MWMLWGEGGGEGSPFLISIADAVMDLFWSVHTQVGTVKVIILVSPDMWSHQVF